MDTLTLGQKIRNFRKRAGMTQMDLELAVGMANGGISRIENGKVNPSKETLLKIGNILKLNSQEMGELFGITTKEEPKLKVMKDILFIILEYLGKNISETDLVNFCQQMLQILDKYININWIAISLSLADVDKNYIQLKYIPEFIFSEFLRRYLLPESSFRKLTLLDNEPTLTKQAVLENKIYINSDITRFTVPPLFYRTAKLIQLASQTKSMIVIPICIRDKVTAVFNFAIEKKIEEYTNEHRQNLVLLKNVVEETIEKLYAT